MDHPAGLVLLLLTTNVPELELPMARAVVLDTDIGTDVDDTWALLQLLACPELDLKLVVTTGGDTGYRAALTARLLTIAGRTDIPVATGVRTEPYGEFQRRWLGDYELSTYPGLIYSDALDAYRAIAETTDECTVISIGPASNVSRLVQEAPDLIPRFSFVGMHGSVRIGYGGKPPAIPEANVNADVPALRTVLAAPWKDCLLTPLDTCGQVVLDGERYRRLRQHGSPALSALFANYEVWADDVTWEAVSPEEIGERSSTLFDTVAVYLAYDETFTAVETHPLIVRDDAMTVVGEGGSQVRLALGWNNLDAFLDQLTDRLLSL